MLKMFISADWSKCPNKRAVYTADITNKHLRKREYPNSEGWNLKSLLELARELSRSGPVLIGVDVVLGVPREYWELFLQDVPAAKPNSFVQWLRGFDPNSDFFVSLCKSPEKWSVSCPWFEVQKGTGGLKSFTTKVTGGMKRRLDLKTNAKPVFAVSGMPGVVGGATRIFWRELAECLAANRRDFSIWPFEGTLPTLLSDSGIVVAETYPRLAYAAALSDSLNTSKIDISHKTKNKQTNLENMNLACCLLERTKWVADKEIKLDDLNSAKQSEDDFDALFTAAAVLRCSLEDIDIVAPDWVDSEIEGSMLLAGPVNPCSNTKKLKEWMDDQKAHTSEFRSAIKIPLQTHEKSIYPCPIPGCEKEFHGSRSGWDTHVASPKKHPGWYPAISDGEERKKLFRQDYNDWLQR